MLADNTEPTATTGEPLVDQRFLDGVYYDTDVDDLVQIGSDTDSEELIITNLEGTDVQRASPETWTEIKPHLKALSDTGIGDPAGYYQMKIAALLGHDPHLDFDPEFVYAQRTTEVVANE